MRSVRIDPLLQSNPELNQGVLRATVLFDRELREAAPRVDAEWSVTHDDRGRRLVLLCLSDWTGATEGRFAPDEFDNAEHLEGRVIHIWGDLL